MRTVDLALFADALAARAAALETRVERLLDYVRLAALEREAGSALRPATVERLEHLGLLGSVDLREARREVAELGRSPGAIHELQAWVETRLHETGRDGRQLVAVPAQDGATREA
ncbi:MAG TPA: hypothetical protein VH306_11605 [Gaiellaceae bacterium]|jgi:hypothetical protein